MQPTRNLIMGAVWDTPLEHIETFVHSARRNYYSGDLALFVDGMPPLEMRALREMGVLVVQAPAFDRSKVSGNGMRYKFYLDFLNMQPFYKSVMLTDVRDVVIQRDPFTWDGLGCSDCLHVFLEEGKRIEECPWNSGWVEVIYGKEAFDAIKHNSISCSGVTLGTFKTIYDYVVLMVTQLNATTVKLGGIDQGVHNYLLWNDLLPQPVAVHDNGHGAVLTMGYMGGEYLQTHMLNGVLLNKNFEPVPVVHQFDRPGLGGHMRTLYVPVKA
jgi:hypothetical protein